MPQIDREMSGLQGGVKAALTNAAAAFVDFALPPACAFCTVDMKQGSATFDGIRLCGRCRGNFTSDSSPSCFRCGMPVGPYVDTRKGCPSCLRRGFHFDQVIRLGVYDDLLKTACIRGKSRGAEALAVALAALLWKEHRQQFIEFSPDVVVCVPQFWLHWFTRPHHQALTMAEVLAERLGISCADRTIRKVRRTVDQSSLPRSRRVKNLQKAFDIRRGFCVRGRRVLIVDDIMTTGTTSDEVAKVIRKAGASAVAVAVIAVVP